MALTVVTATFDTDLYDDVYRTYYGTLDTIGTVTPATVVSGHTSATVVLSHTEATLTVEVADGN